MCVVEAKYAAFVYSGQVRQEERQIVSNNFTFTVHPDLLPENAYPTGTPKPGLVVSVFAESRFPAHGFHCRTGDVPIATAAAFSVSSLR
jgi:hypothetical protein